MLFRSLGTYTHNGIASGSRTSGTYNNVIPTTSGSGTGVKFNVSVDATGLPTFTLVDKGHTYAANDTLTITDTQLGGGGAPNIVITVTAVSGGAGTGATFSIRLNSLGTIQSISTSNVFDWWGDPYMGTFKVPDMVAKKVVGNNSVFGQNSPNAGGGQLGVGTVGILGVFDPAIYMGFAKKGKEDFGQTLGVWGADTGCYFVLPILGPTTTRDAVGLVGNVFIDPVYQLTHNTETDIIIGNDNLQEHNY